MSDTPSYMIGSPGAADYPSLSKQRHSEIDLPISMII